jgi:hypothetical protein
MLMYCRINSEKLYRISRRILIEEEKGTHVPILRMELEPTIPMFQRAKTHPASDSASAVIGKVTTRLINIRVVNDEVRRTVE